MLTKLDDLLMSRWDGYFDYVERTEHIAKLLFAVILIVYSVGFFGDTIPTVHSEGEAFAMLLVYAFTLAIISFVGIYMAFSIAALLALLCEPFIWLYRKICA